MGEGRKVGLVGAFLVCLMLAAAMALASVPAYALDSRGAGRGSVGLMEYVAEGDFTADQKRDAEAALAWLNGAQDKASWYSQVVDLGEGIDATSFSNLENALTYMDAVNGMRRANGLNELKVSLFAMAGAELNCSYSGEISFGHSAAYSWPQGFEGYASENLASGDGAFYGSSNPSDWENASVMGSNWPFTGWYTLEKEQYEQTGNAMLAGHYLNFISPLVNSFGIAVGDGVTIWKGSGYEGSFTVSEFRRVVADYKATMFSDVYDSTAHSEDIWWLFDAKVSEGWLEADGSRTFRGMQAIARQDMAAFLKRLADYAGAEFDQAHNVSFSDVTNATDHAAEVRWLAATGISEGFSDGTFRGLSSVVRQDMAAFLYRLAGSPGYEPSASAKAAFPDVDPSTPHYLEILWLAETGVSEGFPDGTFRPMDSVTRQDMAAFLHRMYEKGLVG